MNVARKCQVQFVRHRSYIPQNRRICINLDIALWQKWGGCMHPSFHPVATPSPFPSIPATHQNIRQVVAFRQVGTLQVITILLPLHLTWSEFDMLLVLMAF